MSDKMAELAVVITGTILDILGGRGSVQQYQRVHDYILSELSNLADHESEKSLLEKTQDWHSHGAVAPSCVGCPTAEAEIENAICVYDTGESCPSCGNSMVSIQTDWFDGESVFCIECGERGALSIDEDGNQWLQAEAEIEHPDDRLSREAGLAMNIELDGKYTRVITERLEAVELAVEFHSLYEALAPAYGYETREETKAFNRYTANGRLMIAVCGKIRAYLTGKDDHETN